MPGNVETVREMYRLFVERDVANLRRLFDAEIEWVQMDGFLGGGRYIGADAIFDDVVGGLADNWEGWKAVIERYIEAGDEVIALGFYEGTNYKTGRSMHAEFAHVVEVRDGKIACFIQYTDTFQLAEAAGLVREDCSNIQAGDSEGSQT